jgi:mRNA interferase ChpB
MAGFSVQLSGAGMQTTGIVRCDQPHAIDLDARRGKKLERASDSIMAEVLARLTPIFE